MTATEELLKEADEILRRCELAHEYHRGYSDGLKAALEVIRSSDER